MGHDPNQLIGCSGLDDQPGIEKHLLAARNKGVDLFVANQVDADIFGIEPSGNQNRIGVLAQDLFDFRVANERRSALSPGQIGG